MQTVRITDAELPNVTLLPPLKALQPMRFRFNEHTRILDEDGKSVCIIPRGFVSDGASVPNFFWRLFPPMGMYLMAAVCHDYFCYLALKERDYQIRKLGDENFHEWLRACDVSQVRARAMSRAVITYGQYQNLRGVYSQWLDQRTLTRQFDAMS